MAVDPRDLDPTAEAPAARIQLPAIPILGSDEKVDGAADLRDIRNIRMFFINTLGANFDPTNEKSLRMVMNLLKDADAAALGALRIKLEERTGDTAEQNRMLAQQILQALSSGNAPMAAPVTVIDGATRVIPTLPDDIETRPFVPGESTQGTINQTFSQFSTRMGGIEVPDESKVNPDD